MLVNSCSPCIMVDDSFIKVLKVVSPPQKPVVSMSFVAGLMPIWLPAHWVMQPIITQPSTLATKVPKGRSDLQMLFIIIPSRCRAMLPQAPPTATSNIFFNMRAKIVQVERNAK